MASAIEKPPAHLPPQIDANGPLVLHHTCQTARAGLADALDAGTAQDVACAFIIARLLSRVKRSIAYYGSKRKLKRKRFSAILAPTGCSA